MSTYTVYVYLTDKLPKEYLNYIYARWLRSLRYGNEYFKLIDQDAYYATYHRYISAILDKPNTAIRLALLSDDKDVILGFSVARGNVLDYVYVHKDQRRMGVGKHLVPEGIDTFTHVTKTWLSIWGSKYDYWRFNPFA